MFNFQKLSASEKILLAEELWDSALNEEALVPLPEEHRKILEERLKAYEANPQAGSSWDDVKGKITGNK